MSLGLLFGTRRRLQEEQLAHALRVVPLFRELTTPDLVAVWRRLDEVRAPAGHIICQRGEPGDKLYVVQSGTLEIRLGLGPDGVSVRRLGPGDCVGEMSLLTGAPRSADVLAADDTVLWSLDRSSFDALVSHSVPLLRALNRVLCARVAEMTAVLEERRRTGPSEPELRAGPFRLVEQIGAGSMAAVFSALHIEDETPAAVKLLPIGWNSTADYRLRLLREAAALRELEHPNVVRVLGAGDVDARLGGGCYLAMEWVPDALDRTIRARFPDPFEPALALRIARDVAAGLVCVHSAGMVHRDVKPSNVLLRVDHIPVITDFGLVTTLNDREVRGRLTSNRAILGTADYLAPEQVAGLPLDGRADLYALGVTLFEMLAGYVPYAGRDPLATMRAHVDEPAPPLPDDVPPVAANVVSRAMAKQPENRYPTARAMADALDDALAHV